jgi:hypothetical protein
MKTGWRKTHKIVTLNMGTHQSCNDMTQVTVTQLIEQLQKHEPNALVRFSVADDESEDDGERWFCENGIEDCFGDASEVTICLVGRSNYSSP